MSNKLVLLTIIVAVLTTFLMGRFVNHFYDQQKHEDNAIKLEVQELNVRLKKVDDRLNRQLDDLYKKLGELTYTLKQQAKP